MSVDRFKAYYLLLRRCEARKWRRLTSSERTYCQLYELYSHVIVIHPFPPAPDPDPLPTPIPDPIYIDSFADWLAKIISRVLVFVLQTIFNEKQV